MPDDSRSMYLEGFRQGANVDHQQKSIPSASGGDCGLQTLASIVLPTYNRASRLPKALRSCLQQTYQNLEVIVVDDGSTDNTAEVVASFQREDSRVRYLRQENQKLPAALNTGFRASRGEFLTWISDDNLFHQDAIEIMVGALEKSPDVGLVYCGYDIVDAQGNLLQTVDPPGPEHIFNLNCGRSTRRLATITLRGNSLKTTITGFESKSSSNWPCSRTSTRIRGRHISKV
jgi:glycosyltransferase involved in cell wall biosynthesis